MLIFPYVRADNIDVLAVEDEGEIVATMTVLRATHFEGLWVSPTHRGNGGLMRSLLRQGTAIARAHGEQWVFGGAEHDQMRGFMDRLGAVKVPMDLYAMWVGEGEQCLQ